jgi:hypothetical protein
MIKGKALLVITRLVDASYGEKHWEVHPYIQSCSNNSYQHLDAVTECFDLMEWDLTPLPKQAHKLNVGDTLRVSVVYEMRYPGRGFEEDGPELNLNKVRVRRVQRRKA